MHKVLFHDVKTKQSRSIIWNRERRNREINFVPWGYIGCAYCIWFTPTIYDIPAARAYSVYTEGMMIIIHKELVKIWKDAVVACFNTLFWLQISRKNRKTTSKSTGWAKSIYTVYYTLYTVYLLLAHLVARELQIIIGRTEKKIEEKILVQDKVRDETLWQRRMVKNRSWI